MRKITIILTFIISAFSSIAQTSQSNKLLVRHDTTILQADECEWIIKSLLTNTSALTSEIGKSVPQIILEAIAKGKIKAIDVESNQPIPAKAIFTWRIGTDTVLTFDEAGNEKYSVVQHLRNADKISRIKIYQDWYVDLLTKKFQSVIKWIELMEEVTTPSGNFIGYTSLCRIYY